MIQWCSYCQSFIGEKDPYQDVSFSHGVCSSCRGNKKAMSNENIEASRILAEKFLQLRNAIKQNNFVEVHRIMDEFLAGKISPVDLAMAFFQPLLLQVGAQWEAGVTSVSEEHRYTSYFENILQQLWLKRPEVAAMRFSEAPVIYLCNAMGSHHNLGLKVVEFVLSFLGVPNFVQFDAVDLESVTKQVSLLKPKMVGVSVSLKNQLKFAEQLALKLQKDFPQVKLLTGGSYFRFATDKAIPPGYILVEDFSALKELLAERAIERLTS